MSDTGGYTPTPMPPPPSPAERPSPPTRGRVKVIAIFATAVLVSGAVGYWASGLRADNTAAEGAAPVSIAVSDDEPTPSSLADTVETVLPSVVNIKVTSVGFDPFGGTTERQGEGSGVIISRDGTILTNNHVVEGAVEVKVEFASGRDALTGTVVGTDADHDVAVVKVDANDLDPIVVGHSDGLRLGQTVVALGYPLGLGPTITQGIVSGLDRSIDVGNPSAGDSESLEGVLQTDAAINPGNSGGPLVDESGRLVGINTAAASPGSAENIGFATAIDEVLPIVKDILNAPASHDAWLGVQIASVDSPEAAAQLGVDGDVRGAYVAGVMDGGPADEAGLEEGSVITELDGHDIGSAEDLTGTLDGLKADDEVVMAVVTPSGGTDDIKVRLGTAPVT